MSDVRAKRITIETARLVRDPPPNCVAQAQDGSMDHVDFVVIGPPGTPYSNRILRFELTYTQEYPINPPSVKFMTAGTVVRIHPNLYTEGKVCLSILGTWSGPPWTPAIGPAGVILSIQSILNDNPIVNEPSFERYTLDDPNARSYRFAVAYETLRVNVIETWKAMHVDSQRAQRRLFRDCALWPDRLLGSAMEGKVCAVIESSCDAYLAEIDALEAEYARDYKKRPVSCSFYAGAGGGLVYPDFALLRREIHAIQRHAAKRAMSNTLPVPLTMTATAAVIDLASDSSASAPGRANGAVVVAGSVAGSARKRRSSTTCDDDVIEIAPKVARKDEKAVHVGVASPAAGVSSSPTAAKQRKRSGSQALPVSHTPSPVPKAVTVIDLT